MKKILRNTPIVSLFLIAVMVTVLWWAITIYKVSIYSTTKVTITSLEVIDEYVLIGSSSNDEKIYENSVDNDMVWYIDSDSKRYNATLEEQNKIRIKITDYEAEINNLDIGKEIYVKIAVEKNSVIKSILNIEDK